MTRIGAVACLLLLAAWPGAGSAQEGIRATTTRARAQPARSAPARPPARPAAAIARPAPVAAAAAVAAPLAAAAAPASEPPSPADPAAAPPAPARLATAPPERPLPPPEPPIPLPHGLEALAGGAWRVAFAPEAEALSEPTTAALAQIGRRLSARPEGRITLAAQTSGPEGDPSAARRRSLTRGLAVKAALAAGGLSATRIDIRPLGRTPAGVDAVEVAPPPSQAPGTR